MCNTCSLVELRLYMHTYVLRPIYTNIYCTFQILLTDGETNVVNLSRRLDTVNTKKIINIYFLWINQYYKMNPSIGLFT